MRCEDGGTRSSMVTVPRRASVGDGTTKPKAQTCFLTVSHGVVVDGFVEPRVVEERLGGLWLPGLLGNALNAHAHPVRHGVQHSTAEPGPRPEPQRGVDNMQLLDLLDGLVVDGVVVE